MNEFKLPVGEVIESGIDFLVEHLSFITKASAEVVETVLGAMEDGLLLVPMHLTGGLSRCFSPFCGAMIAVSGMVEAEPMALCKRNAVPMLFGVLVCFIATFVVFGL